MKKAVLALGAIGLAVYCGLALAIYLQQEQLIFPASKLPADHKFEFAYPFEEVAVPVAGAELSALHFTQANPKGLVFFIHGNAGNLETWTTNTGYYQKVNYDLFIFDFRGYGKSTGQIESEAQLHQDVRAAWDLIAPRYAGKPVVIYGRSIGTSLAVELARHVDAAQLILVSPFRSMREIARREFPWIPAQVLKYPLDTEQIIGEIDMPTLFLHGSRDSTIPVADSEALLALMSAPAQLQVIEGAGHNDIQRFPEYYQALTDALQAH
ncbi:alpha/beta hydrolase [Pseudomaricurvus alcaniphilus]|uniref:alpha/beta hydrolase n=1 Tax=Pseudomaricurvus alcaniphilus TaxID=1166482 RepID=UPI00140BE958|nr:alpha/beta fold hydrolase [Pseudomaricurvus alcaniphilus]NHN36163.1 alpha/beta hydrolase [Pseudomaricurvus alcaniphilus]